jgi:hypothetical protein
LTEVRLASLAPRSQLNFGPSGELWRATLSRIPTVFGRLFHVASLYDRKAGEYSHVPLSCSLGAAEADRVMAKSHSQIFSQWITLSLADQQSDLQAFLGHSREPDWASATHLIPCTATDAERELFLTDLKMLLELRCP